MRKLPYLLLLFSPGLVAIFAWVFLNFYPEYAAFCIQVLATIATSTAVILAIYGPSLRPHIDPIKLRISLCSETNNFPDLYSNNGVTDECIVHHLQVVNDTPHHSIKDCRVWLTQIHDQQPNGGFEQKFEFSVPRLMTWAPGEYDPDKRSFSDSQVFDFGKTLRSSGTFSLIFFKEQGGSFKGNCESGKVRRYHFRISADGYVCRKNAIVEVSPPLQDGSSLIPSSISIICHGH